MYALSTYASSIGFYLWNACEYDGAPCRRERPIDHEDVARAEAEGEEHGADS